MTHPTDELDVLPDPTTVAPEPNGLEDLSVVRIYNVGY